MRRRSRAHEAGRVVASSVEKLIVGAFVCSHIAAARATRSAQGSKSRQPGRPRAPRAAKSRQPGRPGAPRATKSRQPGRPRAPRAAKSSQPGRPEQPARAPRAARARFAAQAHAFRAASQGAQGSQIAFCCTGACFSSLPGRFAAQAQAFRATRVFRLASLVEEFRY